MKEDGILDGDCVIWEQWRLSGRDVPFGPREGAAWYRPTWRDEACQSWNMRVALCRFGAVEAQQ